MKIEIERSGGFAGIIKRATIDTNRLPKDLASILEKHMFETKLNDQPSKTIKSRMADCFYYRISSGVGNRKKQIGFSEFEADKEIKRLVDYVFKLEKMTD
jgi:hypothetical protein